MMLHRIKIAEYNRRRRAYLACKAILRTKYGQYVPTDPRMEKKALLAQAIGGVTGGIGGYQLGNYFANKYGWEPNSWKSRLARWGGAAGGAVLGALVPGVVGWATRGIGSGLSTAGTAMKTVKGLRHIGKGIDAAGKGLKWLGTSGNLSNALGVKGLGASTALTVGGNYLANTLVNKFGGGTQEQYFDPNMYAQNEQNKDSDDIAGYDPSGLPIYMRDYRRQVARTA